MKIRLRDRMRAANRFAILLICGATILAPAFADSNPKASPTRQRPGHESVEVEFPPFVYESVPDIKSSLPSFVSTPDRWRLLYAGKWYDPYNQNILKADIPVGGAGDKLWFVEVSAISDTLVEYRKLPIPVGAGTTNRTASNNTFGRGHQTLVVENIIPSLSLIKGNTSFKPPDIELRVTPDINFNHIDTREIGATRVNSLRGDTRDDAHIGFLELFGDFHLANISDRYDFVSTRLGIQRFTSDFRGFVYADEEPGARLFGNWDNNRYQYNLAWFHRLEKDTNSGVNSTFNDKYEDIFLANLFRQDAPVLGHTLEGSILYRTDLGGSNSARYDDNGFLVRPAAIGDERPTNIHSLYLGLAGDGHFGRINTTSAAYYVTGTESHNPIAGREVDINAGMAAFEASYDIDWVRFRASLFWASGDGDPFDGNANGFDSVFDNPEFAGGDLSFWQRQGIGLIGGGGVNLVNRNSLLPNLRAGKEQGQSNFVNPGLRLYNLGVDLDLLPELKLISNVSFLQFDQVDVLRAVRQDGSFGRDIGFDLSTGFLYRPFLNNNVQLRAGAATLLPTEAIKNLFGDDKLYSLFSNVMFAY